MTESTNDAPPPQNPAPPETPSGDWDLSLVRPAQFEREYMGMPEEPTAVEKRLREMGDEYHQVTESYDRLVCTGPIVRGAIMPNGPRELADINRHALKVRERLWIEAEKLGASRSDLQSAIRDASRRLPNAEASRPE